jgi:hypothetical protein
MEDKLNHSEKGQAIVYLVLGLVVFFGFVALAIDGGMALADRRHEQNAADASSLAGGAAAALRLKNNEDNTCDQQWSCGSNYVSHAESDAISKAINRADANSFTIDHDEDLADHNGVDTFCGGYSWSTAYLTVTVDISATTPSNFLQLVYPRALHNEVEAVSYVDPGGPVYFGNAVVALNDAYCADPGSEGVIMGGSGTVDITGGNIFSNGCLRDNGGVTVTINGGVPYGNDLSHITEDNWSPTPILTNTQDVADAYAVQQPQISGNQCVGGTNINHNLPSSTAANPLRGLICVWGSQGLSINNNEKVYGEGVTIYIVEGPLTVNGTPHIQLTAPPRDPDPSPAIPGVLIYLPASNTSPIKINGDSTSTLEGLILAPKSNIQLNGNNEVMYDGQVIGWNVEITGNADFKMNYDGCRGYLLPPTINLYK